jgi:hypothetical protein
MGTKTSNEKDIMENGNHKESNDRPQRSHAPPLHTVKVFTERKTFFMDLKENDRGKFVKLTEDVKGRRDTILIPIEALIDVIDGLEDIAEAAGLDLDGDDGDEESMTQQAAADDAAETEARTNAS